MVGLISEFENKTTRYVDRQSVLYIDRSFMAAAVLTVSISSSVNVLELGHYEEQKGSAEAFLAALSFNF